MRKRPLKTTFPPVPGLALLPVFWWVLGIFPHPWPPHGMQCPLATCLSPATRTSALPAPGRVGGGAAGTQAPRPTCCPIQASRVLLQDSLPQVSGLKGAPSFPVSWLLHRPLPPPRMLLLLLGLPTSWVLTETRAQDSCGSPAHHGQGHGVSRTGAKTDLIGRFCWSSFQGPAWAPPALSSLSPPAWCVSGRPKPAEMGRP